MTSKNSTPKAEETAGAAEAEASVPQQNTGTDKVTVLKGRGEDGKDAIIVSDGEVDNSLKGKFNRLIRNKKVLAGVGAVAGLVVIAIIKSAVGANNTEFEYTIAEDDREDFEKAMVMSKALDDGATLEEAQALVSNDSTD